MDTSPHTFSNPFRQSRLPAGRDDITAFLTRYHLEKSAALPDAPFWDLAQTSFLREALAGDSDWVEQVDELALQLTH